MISPNFLIQSINNEVAANERVRKSLEVLTSIELGLIVNNHVENPIIRTITRLYQEYKIGFGSYHSSTDFLKEHSNNYVPTVRENEIAIDILAEKVSQ